jgi:hypothetical protein
VEVNTYQQSYKAIKKLKQLGYEELADAILNLLMEPVEFSIEYDAERYIDQNLYGHAKVFANKMRPAPSLPERVLVSEFFGKEYK